MLSDYKLDKDVPIPLYFQLKNLIYDRIKDGTYKPGDMIPTEIEMSEIFDVSRTTIRQAVTELVREGHLYRIKSKGTFVSKPKLTKRVLNRYFSHDETVREAGRSMDVEVLKQEVILATEEVAALTGVEVGEKMIYLYRRRILDNVPMSRVETYLPYKKFAFILTEDLSKCSLTELMAMHPETRVHKLRRVIEAVPASKEDMAVLEVESNSAIQLMVTTRYNENGEFLDIGRAYYRGDQSRIEVELIIPKDN